MKKTKNKKNIQQPAEIPEEYFLKLCGEKYSRNELFFVSIIVLVGLILRIIYFFETKGTPFFTNLYSDSKVYFEWASAITAAGNWVGNEVYFMSPIYPYFLALAQTISSNSITLVRLIQVVVSGLNIWIIYLIARNLFSQKTGYAASIIASVYSIFIFYSGAILSETFQTFVVSLLILLLVNVAVFENKNHPEKIRDRWLVIGLLLGISALFRANILIFFFGASGWIILHYNSVKLKAIVKPALTYFVLGAALPVLVVSARNYIVSGEFVLLTSNGGINFYIGNNSDAPGVFKTPKNFDFFSDMSGKDYAEKTSGVKLTSSQASSYWYKQGFDYISSHTGDAFVLTIKKILLFFDGSENPQSTIMDLKFFAANYSGLLRLPLPGFDFIIMLALAGFILTWKERKKFSLLYIFIFLYVISVIIFFVVGRFRVAIAPLFIVFAGAAIIHGYSLIKSGNLKPIILAVGAVALFVAIESLAAPKFNYTYADGYINLGNTAFENKEYNKALMYYNKSLHSENSYLGHVLIGNTFAVKGEYQAAENAYKDAIKLNNFNELSYFNLGLMYSQTNQLEKAINQFNKVIEINPHFSDAYRNLAIALYMKQEYTAALEYFEKYLPMVKSESLRKSVEGDIENIKALIKLNK